MAFISYMQASQSMDPTQSQDPSMEDDGLQFELPVLEITGVDHGLEGEVISSPYEMFVFLNDRILYRFGLISHVWFFSL